MLASSRTILNFTTTAPIKTNWNDLPPRRSINQLASFVLQRSLCSHSPPLPMLYPPNPFALGLAWLNCLFLEDRGSSDAGSMSCLARDAIAKREPLMTELRVGSKNVEWESCAKFGERERALPSGLSWMGLLLSGPHYGLVSNSPTLAVDPIRDSTSLQSDILLGQVLRCRTDKILLTPSTHSHFSTRVGSRNIGRLNLKISLNLRGG